MKEKNTNLVKKLAKHLATDYVQPEIKKAREIADFCYSVVTGDNQKDIIVKYYDKEDDKQKKQRYKLYDSRTQYVSNKVKSVFKQVDRSDSTKDTIKLDTDNADKKIELMERLSVFHKKEHLNVWLNKKYRNLVFKDPNAMVLVDFSEFDHETEKPYMYPVIYGSHQQIERIYNNGILQELTITQNVPIVCPEKKDTKQLVCYIPDSAITIREVYKDEENKPLPYKEDYKEGFYIEFDHETKTYTFFVELYSTKSKRVPAVCVGYIEDESQTASNYVYHSPMYGATKVITELIKKKSTYDTHMALHGILQKFAYVPECDYKDPSNGTICNSGILLNNEKCPKCHGSGKMPFHVSEQDIITIELPHDVKDEMFDLSKLIHYQTVPTELIEMHKQIVDELEVKVSLGIFNTNMFDRRELAAGTATEIRANLTHVNNELHDFAQGKASVWKFIVTQTAIFLDNEESEIEANRKIPTDYQLESVSDLVALRGSMVSANASSEAISIIDLQIIEKQSSDKPEFIEIVKARERWKPFSDKSESERISAITLLAPDDEQRVLYFNFKQIFNEIENVDKEFEFVDTKIIPPFYKLPYRYQKEVVTAYTKQFIPSITETTIRGKVNAE